MMNKLLTGCLMICVAFSAALLAESGDKDRKKDDDKEKIDVQFKPNIDPVISARLIDRPIVVDGELDDAGWRHATRAANFVETFPGDQVKPPVDTEVLIAYDKQYLYLAFIAEDDPATIRSSLRDRDEMFNDDFVGILIDTYGDAASAYEIFVNPIGVQGDLRLTASNEDGSFDMIYQSQGKITENGFQVEVAIPFSSLRFPDKPQQEWRVNFWRNHPRDSRRRYSWSNISRDDPCFLCQWGTLVGIENVKPGNNLELLPAFVGSQYGGLEDSDDPNSTFNNESVQAEPSLGMRYAFTPSISAEATINPDFSQVESDAAQVDVNTNFALFFPERRPFFQEGGDLYDTWINSVYTRSLNNPQFAGKLTGRSGRLSFGYIGARDMDTGIILPFEEQSEFVAAGRSVSNIFRLRQTFGKDSYIGLMGTDRRFEGDMGGAGSTLGLDGMFRLHQKYHLEWQVVGSRTEEPNDTTLTEDFNTMRFDRGKHSAAFDGETYRGSAAYLSMERDSRTWSFDVDYWHWSPEFRADNGFVFRNDNRQVNFWTGWRFNKDNHKFIDQISPSVNVSRVWNFDGLRKDEWIMPQLNLQLKKQTYVYLAFLASRENYQGLQFDGIRRFMMNVNSNFSQVVSLGFWAEQGRFIARNEEPAVLGKGANLELWGTFKPINQLVIQPWFIYSRLDHPDTDETLFEGYIMRTRFSYQFSREFFLRLVLQYNEFSDRVDVEPLLTYRINPFTIFYIGSSHRYRNYDLNGARDFKASSRQFFLKFQYLFQI